MFCGCLQVQVSDEELMQWFQHIDHVLPHKRVALSELSCAEDGESNNSSSSDIVAALAAAVATALSVTAAHCHVSVHVPVLSMTATGNQALVQPAD